ncbi:riboflavin transporter FmnP [Halarchaeum rubridurum]|uniref:Riboflavin transporter FmnP n=1 Tax=Halarchaeum rubridurum TaxID=489911 RepID=A0A830FXY9_9EURY|nr:HPP family protein [Halarchaeum rubridurum]MBP1953969.1 riboflavin transporter FmnP [Halarchaeum rubridurum]GGM56276.1 hypothetical protein GCM10009017_03080 [Halarchaeum rubridurum]
MAGGDALGDALGFRDAAALAVLLGPLALLAWLTGLPFLLPSLGPSAYVLVARERERSWRPLAREVVLGQVVGVAVAFAAVRVLVGPLAGLGLLPHTATGLHQVAAVVVAVVAATVGMTLLDARHAPAYATVLIFALGIPGRASGVLVFCGGVLTLLCLDAARCRITSLTPVRGR